jgi:hypothetical protein
MWKNRVFEEAESYYYCIFRIFFWFTRNTFSMWKSVALPIRICRTPVFWINPVEQCRPTRSAVLRQQRKSDVMTFSGHYARSAVYKASPPLFYLLSFLIFAYVFQECRVTYRWTKISLETNFTIYLDCGQCDFKKPTTTDWFTVPVVTGLPLTDGEKRGVYICSACSARASLGVLLVGVMLALRQFW